MSSDEFEEKLEGEQPRKSVLHTVASYIIATGNYGPDRCTIQNLSLRCYFHQCAFWFLTNRVL